MASVPPSPKIYHITHIDNLPNIAASMGLVSDANRIASGLSCSLVGMSTIKQRRLDEIEVSCHSGTTVRWAFSNGNAGARLTTFYNHPSKLSEIDWAAVASTDFRDAKVKEGKQAEFLMFDVFPWTLIEKIGTINSTMAAKVQTALANIGHQPVVAIEPSWYF